MEKLSSQVHSQIESRLRELLAYFQLQAEVQVEEDDEILSLSLKTNQDDLLIGRGADPLLALQHLLRIIVRSDFPELDVSLVLNVGDFHEQQKRRLAEVAKEAAAQVKSTNMAVHLPPMSSYERRLIHLILSEDGSVTTESDGTGATRRVVVKPQAG